jgi:hypothetical protein
LVDVENGLGETRDITSQHFELIEKWKSQAKAPQFGITTAKKLVIFRGGEGTEREVVWTSH